MVVYSDVERRDKTSGHSDSDTFDRSELTLAGRIAWFDKSFCLVILLVFNTCALDSKILVVSVPKIPEGDNAVELYLKFIKAEISSPLEDAIPLSSLHVTEIRSSLNVVSLEMFWLGVLLRLEVVDFSRMEGVVTTNGNDKSKGDSVNCNQSVS